MTLAQRRDILARQNSGARSSGFTLIDVLVSLVIIGVLMGLLLPSLSRASETARRVACQSNIRQIGLAIVMYADDHHGNMPPSVFLPANSVQRSNDRPQDMVTVLLPEEERLPGRHPWDGLGILFADEYIGASKVFYCPSHTGEHPYRRYARQWNLDSMIAGEAQIIANYHYRGAAPSNGSRSRPGAAFQAITTNLYRIDPSQSSLVSDAMRVASDYNHKVGVNFFRADLTTHWYEDSDKQFAQLLPQTLDDYDSRLKVEQAWDLFDASAVGGLTLPVSGMP